MENIILFGASRLGEEAFKQLKNEYNILFFLDNDSKKWGTKFFEKEIKSPKDPAIAKDVPIYITSTYYKQIVEQLLQLNFVNIYIVYDLYDVFIVSKYSGESSDVVSNIQESFNRSFHIVPKENLNVRRYESKLEFDSSKQRVFMISDYYYQPGIGGPVTVMYKLFHANEEYKLVDNLFMLCGNLLMSPRKAELYNKTENKTLEKEPRFFDDYPFLNTDQVFHKVVEFKKITQILKRFHTEYEFSAQDAFVFHDENTLYAFSELFPSFKKVTQIHHCQGSRYNEFKAMNGYQNEEMRKILNYIHQKSLTKYIHFGFPSNGAYEELIKTEPDFIPLLENKTLHVLYNGYDRKEDIAPSQGIELLANKIKKYAYKFITVATLNEAKGVERIPKVLREITLGTEDFIWVIVGDGVMKEALADNIDRFGLSNKVIWIRDKVNHEDILHLFNCTDYYLMLHRNSIFDFATIEAMAHSNIPLLSYVGGNKEVIKNENGFYLEEESNDIRIVEIDKKKNILSDKNKQLVKENFSEYASLKRYSELISLISEI